jgi:hypothetical protein
VSEHTGDSPKPDNKVADLAARRGREHVKPAQGTVAVRLAKAKGVLPPQCPIEPVGFDGVTYYLIDCKHQLLGIKPRDLGRQMLFAAVGDRAWLSEHYPRFRAGKRVEGYAAEKASDDLMAACHLMGHWSPDQQIRGRGAWRGEDGDLILHRGDHLVIGGRRAAVGRHGEFVYPLRTALGDLPGNAVADGANGPAAQLLARLDTFAWSRGTLDSYLALGWIVCAMLGGALDFRPHCFLCGEFGAGKSTFQTLLREVLGRLGIISVTNSSAAGLWQAFNCDALPAGVDELESDENRHELIKLARQASSGGRILRGDAHHRGAEFLIMSCFFCSAILMPPMPSQDLSRFHVFNLLPAAPGAGVRPFSIDRLQVIGAGLLRRVADHFKRLTGEVIPLFRERLQEHGYPRRSADLYAALFAGAEVALHDETSTKRLDRWVANHFMQTILADVRGEQTPESERCLAYMCSTRTDYRRPDSPAIGELLAVVTRGLRQQINGQAMQGRLFDINGQETTATDDASPIAGARNKLLALGLRIDAQIAGFGEPPVLTLLVANAHQGLAEVFRNTPWATLPNAAGGGGWTQALRRIAGARATESGVRFKDGVKSRATVLPLDAVFPIEPQPDDREAEAPAAAARPAAPLH